MNSTPTPISNMRFCLLTLGLIAVWILVFASAAPSISKTFEEEKEMRNTRNCKALCGNCGCLGFYCGEECICECNKENSNTECIATMQSNAKKLNIPFELLIQGPTANHFVRNALNYEQNAERRRMSQALVATGRNKRSTIMIYKPNLRNSLNDQSDKRSVITKKDSATMGVGGRLKRSVGNFDWFSDFANVLVRPAPLLRQKNEETAQINENSPALKRSIDDVDRSWFADNTNSLVRPSPLFKRQQQQQQRGNTDEPYDVALSAVENIPKVIKDTLRSIKESPLTENLNEALTSRFKEGAEVFGANLQNSNFDILPENLRENFGELISNVQSHLFPNDLDFSAVSSAAASTSPPTHQSSQTAQSAQPVHAAKSTKTSETDSKFLIPWFRPVRFLQRVHQAINESRQ